MAQWNDLHYTEAGSGPPLVMLHAGIADSGMWDQQVQAFAGRFRVIRPDLRGFGRSKLPARSFSHHEDVIGLLRALGHDRARLLGASFGGSVAIDVAIASPEAVEALVLVAPALGGYEPTSAILREFSAAEESALERGDLDGATELNVRLWVDGPGQSPDRVPAGIREMVRRMQRRAFAIPEPPGAAVTRLHPPARGRLGEIRCPTLVVSGELDVPEFRSIAALVAGNIPGTVVIEAQDAAHLPSLERPDWFASEVLCFYEAAGRP